MNQTAKDTRLHIFLLVTLSLFFVWSFVGYYDFLTWLLDALPVVIGVAILLFTYRRFRFTNFTYLLIWLYAIILLYGAHFSYARTPFFSWLKDSFELNRNYYDRFAHVVQGFVPAIIAREVLLRKTPLQKGGWLFSIVVAFCLAVSAAYEVFEWLVAAIGRENSTIFLAIQGDPWDPQKDMALCMVGAFLALLTLTKRHDHALKELGQ